MEIRVFADDEALSRQAALRIAEQVRRKPEAVLTLAGGETPLGTFRELVALTRRGEVSFEQSRFISLDEWVGLDARDEGSCRHTLETYLFAPLGLHQDQVHFFDGLHPDLQAECERMNRRVAEYGGVDLMLLGIGMNGHLGFNEPGCSVDSLAYVAELDAVTQSVSGKYFSTPRRLTAGITLGMKQIVEAGEVILLASGDRKADILYRMMTGPIGAQLPASWLRLHPRAALYADRPAANKL